jgi:hypothetical protein
MANGERKQPRIPFAFACVLRSCVEFEVWSSKE